MMTENYPPLHRLNRSEAPTSVALAMLLAEPNLGKALLEALGTSFSWKMWRWTSGEESKESFTIPSAPPLQASPLFFRSGMSPIRRSPSHGAERSMSWRWCRGMW